MSNTVVSETRSLLVEGEGHTIELTRANDAVKIVTVGEQGPAGAGATGSDFNHGDLQNLDADHHPHYLNDARLAQKTEIELGGVPVSATFSYTGDQLTQVVKDSVTKSLTYNPDGTLATINDGANLKTLSYTDGKLSGISVTEV